MLKPLAMRPTVDRLEVTGPRRFNITYRWAVERIPSRNARVFVHFTDDSGKICFGNDHDPAPVLTEWKPGDVRQGPFTVHVPEQCNGTYNIYMGLFDPAKQDRIAITECHWAASAVCLSVNLS